jgi:hypothetical protein
MLSDFVCLNFFGVTVSKRYLIAPSSPERYRLKTEHFALQHLVEAQTVRKQYAANGSYFGIRPLPLPNGRLLWPDDSIERLAEAANIDRPCGTDNSIAGGA